jgi:hypothetical protein
VLYEKLKTDYPNPCIINCLSALVLGTGKLELFKKKKKRKKKEKEKRKKKEEREK